MTRLFVRSRGWLSVLLATTSAVLLSFYTGFLVNSATASNAPPVGVFRRVFDLGWINLLLVLGVVSLVLQATLAQVTENLRRRREAREEENQVRQLLEGVVGFLEQWHAQNTYRAMVTIYRKSTQTRFTLTGANIDVDPEVTVEVPANFGIAGLTFETRTIRCGDVTDQTRNLAPDGSQVIGIWPSVRSVLSFPLINAANEVYGTVNVDSDHLLAGSGLDDRRLQRMIQKNVSVISSLLEGRSRKLR